MEFQKVFVGLSIVLLIFTVGLLLYADGAANYGVTIEEGSFNAIANQSIDLAAKQQDMTDKITGGEVSQDNAIDNMIYGASLAIRSLTTSIGALGTIGSSLIIELGALAGYPIVGSTILVIVAFLFIAGIIYLIMRINK